MSNDLSSSSSYDIPSMIPASLLSSSSLKGRFSSIDTRSPAHSFANPTPSHNETEYERYHIPADKRYEQPQTQHDGYHQTNSVQKTNYKNQPVPYKDKNRSKSLQMTVRPIRDDEDNSSSDEDDDSDDENLDDSEDELPMSFEYMLRHPLKSQGQVHDMIHKLERLRGRYEQYNRKASNAAKNIQKTCRTLEKTMRVMAEHFFSDSPDPRSRAKPSAIKGESSENESGRLLQEPTNSKRKHSSISIHQPSINEQSKRPKEIPPSTPVAVTIDNVKLASSDKLDLLFQIDQKKAKVTYMRKPRSLIYNTAPQAKHLNHLMVSSCLGGSVYLWNSKKRTIVNTIDKSRLNIETWAEDLCWVTPDTLAVPVAHKDGIHHSQSQMLLMNLKDDIEYNTDVQSLAPRPHLKGVTAIGSIKYSEDSDGQVSSMFVTGGNDHGLMLWEINKASAASQYQHPSVTPINSRHTSKVLSLHYHDLSQTLYSGGADCKLTWYNLALGNSGSEFKIGERINHILSNPVNPHLLMLCMATRTNQFRLYDLRVPQDSGLDLMFGCTEPDNVSRYLRPDWKPDSWTVASGNMQDHKIHIWDLRYKDVAKGGPSYSWDGHSNKVLRTLFIPGNTMVSIGTDKNTVFTDYQLQSNGKVSTRK
ncbi:hypothetical protein K450DRAFT_230506 [Umbelopsis ramanniana AG]|uniref:WD40 repeat-like protein n=1 Tax=Umbelopsis ramanniana AG TaxID=1314678 RepID=A0AAD5EEM6_UMBRA|nr:uncharacterized protein K450DRAFT_230506 [Umbelopsis ramanniana AG]KAI8581645.1 hypothetical protein K450DRAFT_230506 [Umbelopsis ramanniana AG]